MSLIICCSLQTKTKTKSQNQKPKLWTSLEKSLKKPFCFLELVVKKFYYFCFIFIASKIGLACCGLASFCLIFFLLSSVFVVVYYYFLSWGCCNNQKSLKYHHFTRFQNVMAAKGIRLGWKNGFCGWLIWVTYFSSLRLIFSSGYGLV